MQLFAGGPTDTGMGGSFSLELSVSSGKVFPFPGV